MVAVSVLASLAGGCTIYFGDDTGDDCYGEGAPEIWLGYRDPWTGECQNWGGGGGGCYYPLDDSADLAEPPPDWAACPGACEGLIETTCLDTPGCRGAYLDSCPPNADCDESFVEFLECWGTAPTGPILFESCWGLDAYDCSRTDECIAVYFRELEGQMAFSYCAPEEPEMNGCELVDCVEGYHCELQCYDPCDGPGCDPICEPTCVPDAPGCGEGNECPPDSHCETWCTGGGDCTPDGECPPKECWSECVPDGPDPEVCEALGSEAECAARPDCTAVYDGFGCTCYPDGSCTCEEWVYDHCEGAEDVPVPF